MVQNERHPAIGCSIVEVSKRLSGLETNGHSEREGDDRPNIQKGIDEDNIN